MREVGQEFECNSNAKARNTARTRQFAALLDMRRRQIDWDAPFPHSESTSPHRRIFGLLLTELYVAFSFRADCERGGHGKNGLVRAMYSA
jgi:hypothetical protein